MMLFFDFWSLPARFWAIFGSKMAEVLLSKSVCETNSASMKLPRRFLTSRWLQNDAKIASKILPTDKNRYETTPGATIYRFLPIRRALSKADFRPLSSPISILHIKSWFRIGICGTNSTSTRFVFITWAFWLLFIFKVNKVDFVSIFIDRNGPLFEHTFTMYRKYRVQK